MSQIQEVIDQLKRDAEPEYRKKMEYFNVPAGKALGVRTPQVRKLAKEIKTNQRMAIKLWDSQIHEARMLATMVADPKLFTVEMMEKWLKDVYSWDLCDGACFNLIHKHEDAWQLPYKWMKIDHEFTKRAGFALIAKLALGNKKVEDNVYISIIQPLSAFSILSYNSLIFFELVCNSLF